MRECAGEPAPSHIDWLRKRGDNQIMSLEVMAVAVGLATFAEELRGRKVVVYIDNTAAEVGCSFESWCRVWIGVRA